MQHIQEDGDRVERALPGVDNTEVASLRRYTLAKQEVTALTRAAKQFFEARDARKAAERCQALLVQLAEDRINLMDRTPTTKNCIVIKETAIR